MSRSSRSLLRLSRSLLLSVVAITDDKAITTIDGGRSGGGIGIQVCIGKTEYPWQRSKAERPAKGAGRPSRWVSEGLRLRSRTGCFGKKEKPRRGFEDAHRRGVGLDGSAVFGSSPQPSGLHNRQAGFAAARPAANLKSQWQAVLAVILDDRSLPASALNRELSGTARTFRLLHERWRS